MAEADAITCLVCGDDACIVASLGAGATTLAMAGSLGVDPASAPVLPDYELCRCARCGLEFAWPMLEPGEPLYRWLVESGLRYPRSRWEWTRCLRDLQERKRRGQEIALLDVGCGSGGFIRSAKRVDGLRAIGIDLNQQVVAECLAQGLEAWAGTLSQWQQQREERFDAVCLWHVVEHVAAPVETLESARTLLAPGGAIYFSVPLTPMSYEGVWPDPFNLPPHHLTRWSLRSLGALADRLGMSADFLRPPADSRLQRTLRSLVLASGKGVGGTGGFGKLRRLAGFVSRRPGAVVSEWARQGARARDAHGLTLPDVVLVRLSDRSGGAT